MICRKATTSRIAAATAAAAAWVAASRCRRRGGLGIGTIIVLGLLGWALGIDPRLLIGGAEILTGGQHQQAPQQQGPRRPTAAPTDDTGKFVAAVLGSTEVTVEGHLRRRKARPIARRGW